MRPLPSPARRQRGFSILEIMIGLLVGMLVVLVITLLLANTSSQQRVAGTSADAEIKAALATHILSRELAQAGQGFSAHAVLGCSLTYTTVGDGAIDGAGVTLGALAPVTINPETALVPAGDEGTDTLLVIGGNSASPSEGDALTAASTATSYTVANPASFALGDHVVAAATTRSSPCALTLGKVTAIADHTLTVSAGTGGLSSGAAAVYNLGAAPSIHAYAIRNGNLTMCDYLVYDCGDTSHAGNGTVWAPLASQVASLRAQYGRDTSDLATPKMDGVVDSYDQATPGSSSDTSGLASYCGWLRVVGVRMVVVARSQQYQKDAVTTAAPTWSGSTANTSTSSTLATVTPAAAPIDLGANPEWTHYRYKTIETTVPLRDMIWNGNQVSYQNGSLAC